jgi:ketosteroid isomerase-like protein
MAANEYDRQQISAVLDQYSSSWTAMDFARLKGIWDAEYDNIIYIPEEAAQPVRGWAGIEAYFKNAATALERVKMMKVSEVSIDVFGDTAYAFCNFHFEGDLKRLPQTFIADGRNTFILRRKDGKWKVVHYHESRPHLAGA